MRLTKGDYDRITCLCLLRMAQMEESAMREDRTLTRNDAAASLKNNSYEYQSLWNLLQKVLQ